ncbi:3-coathanger stack domain-containing protein [Bacteroides heparinolyticus]
MIYSQNVLVRNGAKLLFTAQKEIEITPPFTVEKNSEFEMRF